MVPHLNGVMLGVRKFDSVQMLDMQKLLARWDGANDVLYRRRYFRFTPLQHETYY